MRVQIPRRLKKATPGASLPSIAIALATPAQAVNTTGIGEGRDIDKVLGPKTANNFVTLWLAGIIAFWIGLPVLAASHLETPLITGDSFADNADVYVFKDPDIEDFVHVVAEVDAGVNYSGFGRSSDPRIFDFEVSHLLENNIPGLMATAPRVAVNNNGDVAITFLDEFDFASGETPVFSQAEIAIIPGDGSSTIQRTLLGTSDVLQGLPGLGVTTSEEFATFYYDRIDFTSQQASVLSGRLFDIDRFDTPLEYEILPEPNPSIGGNTAVTATPDDGVAVVRIADVGVGSPSNNNIVLHRFGANGNQIGEGVQINQGPASNTFSVEIDRAPSGELLVTYDEFKGNTLDPSISLVRVDNNGVPFDPIRLGALGATVIDPDLAINNDGTVIVTYTALTEEVPNFQRGDIYAEIFLANGTRPRRSSKGERAQRRQSGPCQR